MNNEIKEILEFKENADYKKLSCDEIKVLRDYITNLQQENKKISQQHLETINKLIETQIRIEKAVEYAKENEGVDLYDDVGSEFIRNLLNILNGRSDE